MSRKGNVFRGMQDPQGAGYYFLLRGDQTIDWRKLSRGWGEDRNAEDVAAS